MKAFILAAGLGSRLGELTSNKPKALVQINGQELLGLLITHLKNKGYNEFLVNIHHHSQLVLDYLQENNNFNVQIQMSDEREELLDTGGAILKARHFFKGTEPVLIHNVDIISEIDFDLLRDYHVINKSLATLCVRSRNSDRALLFNSNMLLKGWMNKKNNDFKWVDSAISKFEPLAYNGIYLASPDFPDHLQHSGKFSIIDAWLSMAKSQRIKGYLDKSENWYDLGTPEKLQIAEKYLKSK